MAHRTPPPLNLTDVVATLRPTAHYKAYAPNLTTGTSPAIAGETISTIVDYSGNSLHATSRSGWTKATLAASIDGKLTFRFAGESIYDLPSALETNVARSACLAIFRIRGLGQTGTLLRLGSDAGAYQMYHAERGMNVYNGYGGTPAALDTTNKKMTLGNSGLAWTVFDWTSGPFGTKVRCGYQGPTRPYDQGSSGTAMTSTALAGGFLGGSFDELYRGRFDLLEMMIFDRPLSDSELNLWHRYAHAIIGPSNFTNAPKRLIAIGNSLPAGMYVEGSDQDYVGQTHGLLGNTWQYVNIAVGGSPFSLVAANQLPNALGLLSSSATKNVVIVQEWTNSLYIGESAASCLAQNQAICQRITDAGGLPLIVDCLPSALLTGATETARQTVNAALAAQFTTATANVRCFLGAGGSYGRMLYKASTHPNLLDKTNATYYFDQTHLTALGYTQMANDLAVGVPLA